MTNPYRVLLVCSYARSLINFRGDLIMDLIQKGFEVYCAAPEMDAETRENLSQMKAVPLVFKLERRGLNPIKDLGSIRELKQLIKKHEIDLVFPYTIKPVIYSSIAARQLGIPVISLITGLGYTFTGLGTKAKLLQQVTEQLYRNALRTNAVVIFQNKDDQGLFIERKIITSVQKSEVVNGSGIHLDRFPYRERKINPGEPILFLIIGRLAHEKGTGLFLRSAKEVKPKHPEVEFHLIGEPPEDGPITNEELNSLHNQGLIKYHGFQTNVVPLMSQCDVFALPSFYREGVPRSILEALSLGMPIITTDMPGCRETVNGKNGFLLEPQAYDPLLKAVMHFIEHPKDIGTMGDESRKLAESKFDVRLINAQIIELITSHLPQHGE